MRCPSADGLLSGGSIWHIQISASQHARYAGSVRAIKGRGGGLNTVRLCAMPGLPRIQCLRYRVVKTWRASVGQTSASEACGSSRRAGSHSQRISDCGLFSPVHPQYAVPDPRQKFTFLPRRTRGQEGTDRATATSRHIYAGTSTYVEYEWG
jgi:hypothetical protein